jgi:hypothetical protein
LSVGEVGSQGFVHRAIEVIPLAFDFEVDLIYPPADPRGTLAVVERLCQLGPILDDPPADCGMIHADTPFEHEFFDMARAEGIGHIY